MHFVGDGGALNGGCSICGDDDPVRNNVMLDPDQVAHLKETPRLLYDVLFPGDVGISRKTSEFRLIFTLPHYEKIVCSELGLFGPRAIG